MKSDKIICMEALVSEKQRDLRWISHHSLLKRHNIVSGSPILVMGLQWGNGALMGAPIGEMGENNFGDLLEFLVFLIICYSIFGVLIIQKWLINDS